MRSLQKGGRQGSLSPDAQEGPASKICPHHVIRTATAVSPLSPGVPDYSWEPAPRQSSQPLVGEESHLPLAPSHCGAGAARDVTPHRAPLRWAEVVNLRWGPA